MLCVRKRTCSAKWGLDPIEEGRSSRRTGSSRVTRLGLERGPEAVRDEVGKLDADSSRSLLFVLLLYYLGEAEQLAGGMQELGIGAPPRF